MEPKRKLKKYDGFKVKKEILENGAVNFPMYRYLLEIPLGDTMYSCFVNTEIPSIILRNYRDGFIGLQEWHPIQIIFRDVIGDERTSNQFYEKIRDLYSDYNYTRRKINATISRLDPTCIVVGRWDLRGCFISSIHYGGIDEPDLEITLHYEFCSIIF